MAKTLKEQMAERKALHEGRRKKKANKKRSKSMKKMWANKPVAEKEIHRQKNIEAKRKQHWGDREINDSPAMQELANRELCRRHLLPYIKRFNPDYQAGWVHKDICNRLERFYHAVQRRQSPRMMLMVPPRHGKSTIASIEFPGWVLGNDPNLEFIAASYAIDLPRNFSRQIRDRIQHEPEYRLIFPDTQLASDSRGMEEWRLQRPLKGRFQAAGVGGPITGRGADIFLIDDPVKNREEADSPVVQESTWKWYTSTAYTRLSPGGGVIVILTRWHEQDLGGKVIDNARKSGEDWDIIRYPASAEDVEYYDTRKKLIHVGPLPEDLPPNRRPDFKPLRNAGDALHPARYDEKRLKAIRNTVGPRDWSALYQQRPVSEEGSFIKKKWMKFYTPASYDGMRHIQAWDLAIGQKEQNNHTVGVTLALDWDGRVHVRDVIRGRWSTYEIAEQVLRKHIEYDSDLVGIEHGHIFLAVEEDLRKLEKKFRVRPTYDDTLKPIHDKDVRARPMQGLFQGGDIIFPEGAESMWPWLLEELLKFPALGRDDGFDAMAWACRMLPNVSLPQRGPHTKKPTSWKDKLKQYKAGAGSNGGNHLLA